MNKWNIPAWPQWDEAEKAALSRVLDAGEWGTLGAEAMLFAKEFAAFIGVPYAIPVNNGTQALELLLRGAGVGYGDEVIVPAYTFVATASAVAMTGAAPVFADVDAATGCMDAASVKSRITPRTKAIIAMHMGGRPCDMDQLLTLSKETGIPLLEDAAHAPGCSWRGEMCGSMGYGAAFSFQKSKSLTAGEGGMIVTKDRQLFEACWHYHNSGRPFSGTSLLGGKMMLGTNGRMAEWEAAILRIQLTRLQSQNEKRARGAALLNHLFQNSPLIPAPHDPRITLNGQFLYCFQIEKGRDQLLSTLQEAGLPAAAGYRPLHRMGMMTSSSMLKYTGKNDPIPDDGLENTIHLSQTALWLTGNVLLAENADIERIGRFILEKAREI